MNVFWICIMSVTLLTGTWVLWRDLKKTFAHLHHQSMNRFKPHSSHADTAEMLYHPDLQKILAARMAQRTHKNS